MKPLIALVDDDVSVRESLPHLLSMLGFSAAAFASAQEFLDSATIDRWDCLILDIEMPGMTGPELHAKLQQRQMNAPVIFITAHADEATRLRLLSQGAAACLFKPFSEEALLHAINVALDART